MEIAIWCQRLEGESKVAGLVAFVINIAFSHNESPLILLP